MLNKETTIEHKLDKIIDRLITAVDDKSGSKMFGNMSIKDLEWTKLKIEVCSKQPELFDLLLKQLLKDRFITKLGYEKYQITIEGMLFEGYENRVNKVRAQKAAAEAEQRASLALRTATLDNLKASKDYQKKMNSYQKWIVLATIVTGLFYLKELIAFLAKHWDYLKQVFCYCFYN